MKKIALISIFLSISLFGRENPFVPIIKEVQPIQTQPPTPIVEKKIEVVKEVVVKPSPKKVVKPKPIKQPKIVKKPKKHKKHKKISKPKLIYSGEFIKIELLKNRIKIITKDKILKDFTLKQPNRLVIDFERFDIVGPFSKNIYSKRVRHLKIGHHGYFYRTSFKLNRNYRYKVTKKPYGYLVKLY